MSNYIPRKDEYVKMRVQPSLKKILVERARSHHRTIGGEVCYLIEKGLQVEGVIKDVMDGKTQIDPELLGGRG